MRLSRLVLPAVAAAGLAAAAYAERPAVHVAEYRLPDGGIARVHYTGEVVPRLVLVPSRPAVAVSPFAMLDRIAAMMDAQASAMFAQVAAMQRTAPDADGMTPAALASAPAGVRWTSVSRTVSNGRACTTEVSMVSQGGGKAPQTVRKVSGECAGAAAAPASPTPPKASAVPSDSI